MNEDKIWLILTDHLNSEIYFVIEVGKQSKINIHVGMSASQEERLLKRNLKQGKYVLYNQTEIN